jgi:hypothetical protein
MNTSLDSGRSGIGSEPIHEGVIGRLALRLQRGGSRVYTAKREAAKLVPTG